MFNLEVSQMSRDKRLNRTLEVDGSSPFSSTNRINNLAGARASALLFLRNQPGCWQPFLGVRSSVFERIHFRACV